MLFPREMSLYEPLPVDTGGRHRMDLLGWYQQFVDLGWHVDILHPDQMIADALREYRYLVVPTNTLYDLGDNAALEQSVQQWVEAGGTLLHGPHCDLARGAFGIVEEPVEFDCLEWREEIIPHGWSTVAYRGGKALATYIQTGRTGLAETRIGAGFVWSFGFQYGYAYSRRSMPIVPPRYGKREMHPVVLLKETPVAVLAGASPLALLPPRKGVEAARFGTRVIIVNHGASPVDISAVKARLAIPQFPSAPGWLAAHSGMLLET